MNYKLMQDIATKLKQQQQKINTNIHLTSYSRIHDREHTVAYCNSEDITQQ